MTILRIPKPNWDAVLMWFVAFCVAGMYVAVGYMYFWLRASFDALELSMKAMGQ